MLTMKTKTITRREFIRKAAAAGIITSVPFGTFSIRTGMKKPDSKVNGVQLGLTTYSYRSIPHSIEQTLEYAVTSGVSSLEMRYVLEEGLGIPQKSSGSADLREAQKKWRLTLPMEKYREIRRLYNKAGVNIHIAKFAPSAWSDEEIDYAYNAANALGAYGITDELTEAAASRLGRFAEKHGSLAIFHTHGQFGMPGFDTDKLLGYSSANRLNLDIGHYFGSTGDHPNNMIEKYHKIISSIHVKDKTGPKHPEPDVNKPFGLGETPIADVLLLIKKEKWPINVDLELEYDIPRDSDPVKEVTRCMEYMRNILE